MDYVDQYCERIAPGLLGEPINAITNLVFFIAAWAAWRLACQQRVLYPSVLTLVALLAAIGVGSSLFHIFANRLTEWADVLPILAFQLFFVWAYLRRVQQWGLPFSYVFMAGFITLIYLSFDFSHLLNGSLGYGPALFVLLVLSVVHITTGKKGRFVLLGAAGVFVLSLTFRTLDMLLCPNLPFGTHFMWHILNGMLLYLLMKAIVLNLPPLQLLNPRIAATQKPPTDQ